MDVLGLHGNPITEIGLPATNTLLGSSLLPHRILNIHLHPDGSTELKGGLTWLKVSKVCNLVVVLEVKYPFLWEVRCYLWRASLRLNVNFLCGGRPVHRQSRQCKLKRNKHMIILEGNYHTRWIVALEHLGLLCFSGCNKQKHPHILMSSPVQHMVAFRAPGRSLPPSPDSDGDPVLNSSKKWNAHICLVFLILIETVSAQKHCQKHTQSTELELDPVILMGPFQLGILYNYMIIDVQKNSLCATQPTSGTFLVSSRIFLLTPRNALLNKWMIMVLATR